MERRRFLKHLGAVSAAPMLGACSRAFAGPARTAVMPEPGPGTTRDPAGVWREGAAYARWAPSPHNVQPWRLRVTSDTECELLYDPTRLLPTTDPTSAFTIMGLAMFVEYLSIAVGTRGYAVDAVYDAKPLDYSATRPTRFARLSLIPARNNERFERSLMLDRHTSRLPYDGRPVDEDTMEALARISREYGQTMAWSSNDEMVRWVVDVNRFTLFKDLDDAPTRTELRRWIRTTDADAGLKKDGLWSHCLRFPGWLLQAFFDQHEKWGRGWRARMCGRMLVRGMNGTRTVAWLSGPMSGPNDWIRAGTCLGRIWLELARRGVQMHPFGSVITNPEAYTKLVAQIGAPPKGSPFWMLARLGRSDAPPHSYRVDTQSIFLDDDPNG